MLIIERVYIYIYIEFGSDYWVRKFMIKIIIKKKGTIIYRIFVVI